MGALHSTEKLQAAKLRTSLLRGDISDTLKIIDENPRLYTIALDDESGHRALHLAVQQGFHDFLLITSKYCTQGVYCPVSHFDGSGAGGRAMPAIQRHAHSALDRGRGHDGVTPLMLACDLGDQEAARLLMEAGSDPWHRDEAHGGTCLHYAAAKGHLHVIRTVLQLCRSMDMHAHHRIPLIEATTLEGFTPLMYAAWYNQAATVELLLEEGADLLKKTKHYGTIGEVANPGSHEQLQFPGWSTALHVAAGNGSEQTALALLQANHRQSDMSGLDLRSILDGTGRTAFNLARILQHRGALLTMLNPLTNWAVFVERYNRLHASPEVVPTLRCLAGKVAREVLIHQIQVLSELRLQDQHRTQACMQDQATLLENSSTGEDRHDLNDEVLKFTLQDISTVNRPMSTAFSIALTLNDSEPSDFPSFLDLEVVDPSLALIDDQCNEGRRGDSQDSLQLHQWHLEAPHYSSLPMADIMENHSLQPYNTGTPSKKHQNSLSLRSRDSFKTSPHKQHEQHGRLSITCEHHLDQQQHPDPSQNSNGCLPSSKPHHIRQSAFMSCQLQPDNLHQLSLLMQSCQEQLRGALRGSTEVDPERIILQTTNQTSLGSAYDSLAPISVMKSFPLLKQHFSTVRFDAVEKGRSGLSAVMSSEQRMNSLRIALATLTGETSRDQLEETLTACRFHRLVHGVDEPQQDPFIISSYTLLRHPSLTLKQQQQHIKGVMINPKLLSTHQAVYGGLAVSDRGPAGSSIGQNASASTDRGPAGSSIGQNASASTDRGPAGSSTGQNASASTESPVVALLPSSPAEAESLITRVSTENMNDGYALPLGDYNASLQNSRQTQAEKSTHHDEYDSCCGICLDHGDFVIIDKCSHALCVDCALELLKVHPSDLVPCPFCRGPIQGFRI